jgi:hypothetical protein
VNTDPVVNVLKLIFLIKNFRGTNALVHFTPP